MRIIDVSQNQSGTVSFRRICRVCGNDIRDNGKHEIFCNKCGHKFIQRPSTEKSSSAASIIESYYAKDE